MNEVQLPVVALIFSILLGVVFFSKKRVYLLENKVYGYMIVFTIIDSFLVTIIRYLSIGVTLSNMTGFYNYFVKVLNRVDFLMLILFATSILIYTLLITFPNIKEKAKIIFITIGIFDLIAISFTMFTKLEFIEKNNMLSIGGPSVIPVYLIVGLSLLLSILITISNYKKITKRHVPVLSMIIMAFLLMYIYRVNPYVVVNSIVITFIIYLMFFTIENPDIRMIEALNIAKGEADKANLAKSDFLASMSHEIRTPLNAITGFSHAILNMENIPDEIADYAKDIVKSSDTLLEIVGGVLDVSKIESNKMEIIDVLYNPREEFESIAKIASSRIGEKPIIFNIKIAEDVPYQVYGDKGNIKKIVTNLLTNAVKYTKEGQILFNIKCINQNDVSYLIISVQDTGLGIKEENITKLFTKFERLDVEKNTTAEGTGLGLAITKKLVDLMGGKINVKSQFGVGSIFMVQIPQKIAMMSKPLTDTQVLSTLEIKQKRDNELKNIAGKRFLIVDDNALNIKVAKIALKGNDLIFDEATNGKECINKIKNGEKYDLILMDIMMPGMSGEETFEILKNIPNFNIPTIALTADAVSGSKERYLNMGFTSYISKPFSPDEIKIELAKIFK